MRSEIMVGKNNHKVFDEKMSQHFTKWSIRKLNVGVASVAVAAGFFIAVGAGSSTVVHADMISPVAATETAEQSVAQGNNYLSETEKQQTENNQVSTVEKGAKSTNKPTNTNDEMTKVQEKVTVDAKYQVADQSQGEQQTVSQVANTVVDEKNDFSAEPEIGTEEATKLAQSQRTADTSVQSNNQLQNGDISELPDNINWDTPRHDDPLSGINSKNKHGIDQKGPAIIYSPIEQNGGDGYNVTTNRNDNFAWQLEGIVGISKDGQAIADGTGTSGIINPDNKQNIIWLGKYDPQKEMNRNGISPKSFVSNANSLPKGTQFSFDSGWFKPKIVGKSQLISATENEVGAKYYNLPTTDAYKIQPIVIKITYPDKSSSHYSVKMAVDAIWNLGISQAIKVKPNEEIVLTPSWVSNGNVNGTDQLKLLVFNAEDPGMKTSNYLDHVAPLATVTTNATNAQGFVFKVPAEGVNKLRIVFQAADTTVNHTGLSTKDDILVSGLTGATIVNGSKLSVTASSSGQVKQNQKFIYKYKLENEGESPSVAGSQLVVIVPKEIDYTQMQLSGDFANFKWLDDTHLAITLKQIAAGSTAQVSLQGLISTQVGELQMHAGVGYDTETTNHGGYINGTTGFNNMIEIADVVNVLKLADTETNDAKTRDINVELNQTPNVEDGIVNKSDLPVGTKFGWKNPVDTSRPGDVQGIAVVTYPDNSTDEVVIIIHIKDKQQTDKEQESSQRQDGSATLNQMSNVEDGIADNDDLSSSSQLLGTQVDQLEGQKLTTKGTKVQSIEHTTIDNKSMTTNKISSDKTGTQRLPKTGEQKQTSFATMGGVLLAIASLYGLGITKKRSKEE